MEMLSLSHVAKSFEEKQVLKDVSFSVPEHTVFGFVGQNGAGKTTAMKLILGLLSAESGEIYVNGMQVCYGNALTNQYVGYLPDVPGFYPYMTPYEYLGFCGEIVGMPKKEIKSRSDELLNLVGLENEKHRIKGFSRGMKQRLGIAQAMFGRPKLLICDEPASALDPIGRKELLDILSSAKEQTTVIFSTHILSDVENICDGVALLHDGKITLNGSLEDLRKKRKAATEFETESSDNVLILQSSFPFLKLMGRNTLLLDDMDKMADILHFIADKRMPMRRIEKKETELEELFMEAVGR